MADKDIKKGDKVQWNYGAGQPKGFAAEVKSQPGEKVQIKTKRGNIVSRNADEDNPAVRVERGGEGNKADVVKRMSELEKVAGYEEDDIEKGEENVKEDEGEKGVDTADAKSAEEKEPIMGEKRAREVSQVEQDTEEAGSKESTAAEAAPAHQQPTEKYGKPKAKKVKVSRESKARGKTKVKEP
ncbi:hypothetical protein P691DRAFT_618224, partial [Macrolepiota fuliginosa MF-IS2]